MTHYSIDGNTVKFGEEIDSSSQLTAFFLIPQINAATAPWELAVDSRTDIKNRYLTQKAFTLPTRLMTWLRLRGNNTNAVNEMSKFMLVFMNGVKLIPGTQFTVNNATGDFLLNSSTTVQSTDVFEFFPLAIHNANYMNSNRYRTITGMTGPAGHFLPANFDEASYVLGNRFENSIMVFKNGLLLSPKIGFSIVGNKIVMLQETSSTDIIEVLYLQPCRLKPRRYFKQTNTEPVQSWVLPDHADTRFQGI